MVKDPGVRVFKTKYKDVILESHLTLKRGDLFEDHYDYDDWVLGVKLIVTRKDNPTGTHSISGVLGIFIEGCVFGTLKLPAIEVPNGVRCTSRTKKYERGLIRCAIVGLEPS